MSPAVAQDSGHGRLGVFGGEFGRESSNLEKWKISAIRKAVKMGLCGLGLHTV